MRKFWISLAAAGALALGSGCASTEENLDFPEPALTLTSAENGKTFSMKQGQYVKISLKENPTTGYMWYFRLNNGKEGPQMKSKMPLSIEASRFLSPEEQGVVGAPGLREIMVKAVHPGTVYLIGECIRSWEANPQPAVSIKYRIDVSR